MNIGVFFGSRSPEHDVSIITGQLIIQGLKKLGHTVVPVYLDKAGRWLVGDELGELAAFREQKFSPRLKAFYLDLEVSHGRMVFKKKGLSPKRIDIDLAFPAFHGSYGEDGTIQGLFEMLSIPYVGCDVTSSALTMDKILTKQFYQANGIPTTKFVFYHRTDWQKRKSAIIKEIGKLKRPLFVKPSRLGSSIGIAKVKRQQDLEFAIEVALHYEDRFLVEESVENLMDVTAAVIGNENPEPSLLQESLFGGEELFSYEEKYLKEGGTQFGKAESSLIIPARLSEAITREIRTMAVRIFKLFGCSGIARVDFLYDKKGGKFYANEVNTMPGTLYHHLWKKSGIEFPELLSKLIALAKARHENKERISLSFDSDILKFANSAKLKLKERNRDEGN